MFESYIPPYFQYATVVLSEALFSPPSLLEFYNSGSTDQQTIRANSASLDRLLLRSRVLVNVSNCDTSTTLWGKKIAFPLGIAPAGIAAMAHSDGELATSRACARIGVPMGVSSFANHLISDITDAAANVPAGNKISHAMQLYTMSDRALQERIVKRAESSGCKAVFLTADSPVIGVRYNEWHNDFRTPEGLGFPNLEWTSEDIRKMSHDDKFHSFNDDGHEWGKDIRWLRERTGMEVWVKGVMCKEDVEKAVEAGVDGVIVSCFVPFLWIVRLGTVLTSYLDKQPWRETIGWCSCHH
jgi:(S)-2-hydroxy-acid oxidase